MSEIKNNCLMRIFEHHNSVVNNRYSCDIDAFTNWVMIDGNFDENYIEVPSYQTKSGSPVILDW